MADALLAIDAFDAFETSERYLRAGFRDFPVRWDCASICESSELTVTTPRSGVLLGGSGPWRRRWSDNVRTTLKRWRRTRSVLSSSGLGETFCGRAGACPPRHYRRTGRKKVAFRLGRRRTGIMTSEIVLDLEVYLRCHIQAQKNLTKPGASPQKVSPKKRSRFSVVLRELCSTSILSSRAPVLDTCIDKVLQLKIQSLDPSDEQRCVLFRGHP